MMELDIKNYLNNLIGCVTFEYNGQTYLPTEYLVTIILICGAERKSIQLSPLTK